MAALTELLLAVDSYMKTTGNKGDKYIAKKIGALFESEKSPFNVQKGVLKELNQKIANFSKKFEELSKPNSSIETFGKFMKSLSTMTSRTLLNMGILNLSLTRYNREIDKILKKGVGVLPTPRGTGSSTTPRMHTSSAMTIKNFNQVATAIARKLFRNLSGKQVIPIYISGASAPFFTKIKSTLSPSSPAAVAANVVIIKNYNQLAAAIGKIISKTKIKIKTPPPLSSRRDYYERNRPKRGGVREGFSKMLTDPIGGIKQVAGGIFSTIWNWIKMIGIVVGSIFAIGKLRRLLANTETGRNIKEKVSGFFKNIFTIVADYLTGDDFKTTIIDGLGFIHNIFSAIFKTVSEYYDKHKDQVDGFMKGVLDAVWNNIVAPIGNTLKKWIIAGATAFWEGIVKNVKEADWESLLIKGGVIAALVAAIGGFGLVFNPLTIALVAATSSVVLFVDQAKKFADDMKDKISDAGKVISSRWNSLFKTVEDNKNLQKTIDAGKSSSATELDKLKAENAKYQLSLNKEKYINDYKDIGEEVTKYIPPVAVGKYLWNMFKDTEKKANTPISSKDINDEKLRLRDGMELHKANKELIEKIKGMEKMPERQPVNDAIIVEPHSKDQILMGKAGGPIDLALKDMNSKFDDLIIKFNEGFSAMVQASMGGSQLVANAVVGSAGSGGSQPTTASRTNPVQDQRNRAQQFIDGRNLLQAR